MFYVVLISHIPGTWHVITTAASHGHISTFATFSADFLPAVTGEADWKLQVMVT